MPFEAQNLSNDKHVSAVSGCHDVLQGWMGPGGAGWGQMGLEHRQATTAKQKRDLVSRTLYFLSILGKRRVWDGEIKLFHHILIATVSKDWSNVGYFWSWKRYVASEAVGFICVVFGIGFYQQQKDAQTNA